MPKADSIPTKESSEDLLHGRVGPHPSLDCLAGVSVGFSASLLHDLRQPVSAILFNALAAVRIVRKEESPWNPMVEESLTDIIHEVDRLKTLLQGLGTYLGLAEDEVTGLEVNETLARALGLLSGECIRRQFLLSTDFGPDIPALQVSSSQLTRAVISLALDLFQALEAAPVGARQICVSTQFSAGLVKIGFQVRALPIMEGKSPPPLLQLQAWHGRTFVSQEPPELITWGIELPLSPTQPS